ncbi:MAG: YihA family ribosome biogenesis GTP-binding protein [Gammaproteobacteria bacterium]|nr:YihA family ribosome biogenesis GTP-binding protein [Gammaproteobacteria bacterium]
MTNNPYRGSQFLTSAAKLTQFPVDTGREVAFIGRSNVGKSSIINCLTENKRLAKTSKTPGRTRLINFFTVTDGIRLVDLPGYGFARVNSSMKRQWSQLINDYFMARDSLCGIILIIDIRRQLRAEDLEMIDWGKKTGLPIHLIVNKADKLPFNRQKRALKEIKADVDEDHVSVQLFSMPHKSGVDDVVMRLNAWLVG